MASTQTGWARSDRARRPRRLAGIRHGPRCARGRGALRRQPQGRSPAMSSSPLPGAKAGRPRLRCAGGEQRRAASSSLRTRPPGLPPGVVFVRVAMRAPRLSRAAARFYPRQPATIVAVTGTSGKTSVAAFARQIWARLGLEAASLGTIGIVSRQDQRLWLADDARPDRAPQDARCARGRRRDASRARGLFARPRPEAARRRAPHRRRLHQSVARPPRLSRRRRRPISPPSCASSKRLLPAGVPAVIDADSDVAASGRGGGAAARPRPCSPSAPRARRSGSYRRRARASRPGSTSSMRGRRFDASTAACRAIFRSPTRLSPPGSALRRAAIRQPSFAALETLEGAPGRLERVGERRGAPIFVDYAHKPDALEKALAALRPFVRGRLIVVFGCGGDRDPGKRPIMGEIAARGADIVIVTDDNPRSEESGRDPRRDPRRRAGRDRDRRPRRGDPRRRRHARRRRRAADRRKGS